MNNELKTCDNVVTRVFNAPVEEVWKAWTEPEMVKRWWGPTGFTCPLAEMDFREGGTSLVCMRAPKEYGGQDLYNTWTYKKIVPYEMFEYILKFTDQDGNALSPAAVGIPAGVPKEVRKVNKYKDLGNGKTELTVTEYGYTTEEGLSYLSKVWSNASIRWRRFLPGEELMSVQKEQIDNNRRDPYDRNSK